MRFLVCLLLLLATSAHAQFGISVSLPRSTFMALEAIPATVTIANRSGADVVLGGPGRSSWLSFEMTDSAGHPLAPIEVSAEDMVQIPAGGTVQRKIVVTDAFAPTEIGNYALTARVLHPPTQQFYGSNRARFAITDAKPIWEQSFGVPDGYRNVGKICRYALSIFREAEQTSLYFRLIDDQTGMRMQTYALGPISMIYDPQITVDRENRLQVLFLAMPKLYTHVIVKPDGSLFKRGYYRETEAGRPQMVSTATGETKVLGGEYMDPSKPAATGKSRRKVSERPPGL